jgi:ubiquinone/menaquinone biosynthesis C-methylase UbiE
VWLPPFLRRWRSDALGERLRGHLSAGETLLDVGAGTGFFARWLQDRLGVRPTLCDRADYRNRDRSLPFVLQPDPMRLPADDRSFDAVLVMFVLHHLDAWEDQERLLAEAARVARRRVIVVEDTPRSAWDRAMNRLFDWVLNVRHGIPTPFTFRSAEAWSELFRARGLAVAGFDTFRSGWPTFGLYRQSVFVLER